MIACYPLAKATLSTREIARRDDFCWRFIAIDTAVESARHFCTWR